MSNGATSAEYEKEKIVNFKLLVWENINRLWTEGHSTLYISKVLRKVADKYYGDKRKFLLKLANDFAKANW